MKRASVEAITRITFDIPFVTLFVVINYLLALISQKEYFVMSSFFFRFMFLILKDLNITRTKQITLIISFEYF